MEKSGAQMKPDLSGQNRASGQGATDELSDILDSLNLQGDSDLRKIFDNGYLTNFNQHRIGISVLQDKKVQ